MKAATERVALGKMMNAGQICLAPDYLLVPEEKEAEVIDGLKSAVSLLYPKLLDNDDYASVINARHRDRLKGYLDDAKAKGAELIEVNPRGRGFFGDQRQQAAADHRPQSDRRHDGDAGRDFRPDPAGQDL